MSNEGQHEGRRASAKDSKFLIEVEIYFPYNQLLSTKVITKDEDRRELEKSSH